MRKHFFDSMTDYHQQELLEEKKKCINLSIACVFFLLFEWLSFLFLPESPAGEFRVLALSLLSAHFLLSSGRHLWGIRYHSQHITKLENLYLASRLSEKDLPSEK